MRATSRPNVTAGELPETDADPQHSVAYLEHTMEQNLPFDVDALLVFGKVVENRSLSKAAALLGMPKSTVSRKLTKLESDLGIKLLRKNTHQLTVTDLGEQIYAHAANISTEANGVRALVEGARQEPQGELKVAIPVFVGIDYASRVGATFLQRHPNSRLDIRLVDTMVDRPWCRPTGCRGASWDGAAGRSRRPWRRSRCRRRLVSRPSAHPVAPASRPRRAPERRWPRSKCSRRARRSAHRGRSRSAGVCSCAAA